MSKYKKMKQLIADMRLPEYRYKQLLDAVFLQGIMRFEDMKLLASVYKGIHIKTTKNGLPTY